MPASSSANSAPDTSTAAGPGIGFGQQLSAALVTTQGPTHPDAPASQRSRNSRFNTLPISLRGSSGR
jgi:hypothetical protein